MSKTLACAALAAVLTAALSQDALARPFRPQQIPNGAALGCGVCHVNPGGGGPRNDFGVMVGTSFLSQPGSAGNVLWGPELAALDADDDGATNGEELGDPQGTWTPASPAPGDPAALTNPGDPASTPEPTAVASSTWGALKDQVRRALD
ncbi:MAG: hypothetical protein AB1505_25620 [Candidatus Latescibacterota bacterium]